MGKWSQWGKNRVLPIKREEFGRADGRPAGLWSADATDECHAHNTGTLCVGEIILKIMGLILFHLNSFDYDVNAMKAWDVFQGETLVSDIWKMNNNSEDYFPWVKIGFCKKNMIRKIFL